MPIDSNEATSLLSGLVAVESTNPWLLEGAAGEAAVARYISDWLAKSGISAQTEEVLPGRSNVVARLGGTGGGQILCLNAHVDTVGLAGWPDQALRPRIEGDRLYGLGAADDKGQCVAALLALKSAMSWKRPLSGEVIVAFTVDEEGASKGTEHLVTRHKANAAIVLEPVGLGSIVVSHQGFGWVDVVVHGVAAHGSEPEKGVDAIVQMAEVIQRLHRLDVERFARSPHRLNGKTVFHTGTIRGGTDYATYPSACVVGLEIGTQPGETMRDRTRDIEAILEGIREVIPTFKAEFNVKLEHEPFEAQGHEVLLGGLSEAIEEVLGRTPTQTGLNAWTDSALMQTAGIPTLMIGARGGNLHAPDEWVSLTEVVQLAQILEHVMLRYCH